jgi:hypothetical protein
MTRIGPTKKGMPHPCRLHILQLSHIQSVKLYESFWEKRYKETGSIWIRAIAPKISVTLHNLAQPDHVMNVLTNALDACRRSRIAQIAE